MDVVGFLSNDQMKLKGLKDGSFGVGSLVATTLDAIIDAGRLFSARQAGSTVIDLACLDSPNSHLSLFDTPNAANGAVEELASSHADKFSNCVFSIVREGW
ncbi:unnamed protein product [Protopolystoma xenopodis]|uniref:Uncharacterized protein n=1 Tax=Protopolystoma xenopodis TaxID=117903 RepID=A0A3S5B779_9PLAT|nr:unnamed protein product [Protopolystoma xenopodis]